LWPKITPTSAHFEQAFSEDGGRSWDVNWISDMMRIGDVEDAISSGAGTVGEQPGQRDFEPLLGRWSFHLKVRLKPLTGSTQWVGYTGLGDCTPLWHGRAQLDTINLEGPTKHIEGLTVRSSIPRRTSGACIGPTAGMDSSWCRKSDSSRRVMASSTRRTCSMTKHPG
jgi:hypothetical protein